MKKNLLFSLAILFSLATFSFVACDKDDNDGPDYNDWKATLAAAPGVTTAATGSFVADYDDATNVLSYKLTFSGLAPNAAHLHNKFNPNGDIIPLPEVVPGAKSPIEGKTAALTDEQEAVLKAGRYYVNVHTDANPAGEIQGDVTAQ